MRRERCRASLSDTAARGPWSLAWRRLRRDPAAVVAASVIVVIVALALGAPLIEHLTGHPPDIPNVDTGTDDHGRGFPPGESGYLLGSDNLGRDILVRLAYGARISLTIGVISTAVATLAGVTVGMASGYYRGWISALLSRVTDIVLSLPYILVSLALVAALGSSVPLVFVIIVIFSWAAIARIVRGQVLSEREKEYVEAARSLGAGDVRIMVVDVLPNLLSPIITLVTLLIPTAIVFESSLSFLGIGVPPPSPSWGNMLADAQAAGYTAWWLWVFPAVVLLLTTVAFNVLGDCLRDALDPGTARVFARPSRS